MGLLSAGSTSNNNIIIPMIPLSRPVSNLNFGGGQLWNNLENNNKNINNKNLIDKGIRIDEDKNEQINNNLKVPKDENNFDIDFNQNEINMNLYNSKNNYNIYNKSNQNNNRNKMLKSQEIKHQYETFPIKNNFNNLYLGMDKIINKLHKIKIEKGMMNNGILNSLNKKFNNDYQTQIEQFKKNHLPMMFINQNNNKINKLMSFNNNTNKNKSSRSHSFNNRNNF